VEDLWQNYRMQGEGYAGETSVTFILCQCSLKLTRLKGYVGGLDVSAFNCLHIGLVASAMI
jgi:hypothetical protein